MKNIPNRLRIQVMDSEKILYSGPAEVLTSENEDGKFDLLPGHRSFISIVKHKVTIHVNQNKSVSFDIGKGVLKCTKDVVEVLIGLNSV